MRCSTVLVMWLTTQAVHTSLMPQPDTVGHSSSCTRRATGVLDSWPAASVPIRTRRSRGRDRLARRKSPQWVSKPCSRVMPSRSAASRISSASNASNRIVFPPVSTVNSATSV